MRNTRGEAPAGSSRCIPGVPSAGSISQTITYPFDVLRRKMQVTGMSGHGKKYNGAVDALWITLQTEGPKGLYRGIWPNLRAWLASRFIHRKCHADSIVLMMPDACLR